MTMSELCHYTSAARGIRILREQEFVFGHLENTNDPFENLINRYNISYSVPKELDSLMYELFCYTNKELSYASFGYVSEDINPGEHWTMWAHYGKLHSGICLVFDKDALINEISNQNKNFIEGRINYSNNILLNPSYFEHRSEKSYMDIVMEFKDVLLFSKHKAWLTENEYRIVVFDKYFRVPIKNCLKKIIYGPEIKKLNISRSNNLLKKMNFTGPYGRLEYAMGSYAKPSIFFFHHLKESNSKSL